MALDNAKNFAKVTVSTGYDASATSIVLTTGHGAKLPTVPFNAVWWNSTDYADPADDPNVEIVRVTARSTDTLTVTRAQEGTSASTKNTGSKTYKMIAGLTAKVINTDLAIPTVKTVYPVPLMPMDDAERNLNMPNNTTGYFFAFYVPHTITVNQISFIANRGATDDSTFKVAIYSEDGQTRHISVTTALVTSNGQILETAVGSVTLNPGLYYIGICLTTNFASTLGFRTHDYSPGVWNAMNGYDLTSKPKASGTMTITAGTLPTTFNPVSDLTEISATAGSFFVFRLDN